MNLLSQPTMAHVHEPKRLRLACPIDVFSKQNATRRSLDSQLQARAVCALVSCSHLGDDPPWNKSGSSRAHNYGTRWESQKASFHMNSDVQNPKHDREENKQIIG